MTLPFFAEQDGAVSLTGWTEARAYPRSFEGRAVSRSMPTGGESFTDSKSRFSAEIEHGAVRKLRFLMLNRCLLRPEVIEVPSQTLYPGSDGNRATGSYSVKIGNHSARIAR